MGDRDHHKAPDLLEDKVAVHQDRQVGEVDRRKGGEDIRLKALAEDCHRILDMLVVHQQVQMGLDIHHREDMTIRTQGHQFHLQVATSLRLVVV
jgi:hypothetical protein